MNRRRWAAAAALVGSLCVSLSAHAQQKAMPVIGFLSGTSPDSYAPFVAAFRDGLRQAGFNEGESVAIEYRLLERDGQWGVYDIAVDDVSLISNYRSQLTSMLKRMTFAQLLDRLRNREAAVRSRHDPD